MNAANFFQMNFIKPSSTLGPRTLAKQRASKTKLINPMKNSEEDQGGPTTQDFEELARILKVDTHFSA